jgi:hypothetical protein
LPLNEYDALLPSSEGGAPANEYDQIMLDGNAQQKQDLDSAKFVASKRDPKRWAQVVDIAKRTKLPTEVVDRNFEQVSAADKKQNADQEYDRLISDTPGLSQVADDRTRQRDAAGRDEIASANTAPEDFVLAHEFGRTRLPDRNQGISGLGKARPPRPKSHRAEPTNANDVGPLLGLRQSLPTR